MDKLNYKNGKIDFNTLQQRIFKELKCENKTIFWSLQNGIIDSILEIRRQNGIKPEDDGIPNSDRLKAGDITVLDLILKPPITQLLIINYKKFNIYFKRK